MNEEELQVKSYEDLISAVIRRAIEDEVIHLVRGYYEEGFSVREFIQSGEFDNYARLLISLDPNELLKMFWEAVAYHTLKELSNRQDFIQDVQALKKTISIQEEWDAIEKELLKYA